MNKRTVSKATLGRLPEYLKLLKSIPSNQSPLISATTIAKKLNLGEVQVRKDLAAVSGTGKPRVGYVTANLIKMIETYLCHDDLTPAILIGAGKLGRALLDYEGFKQYGVQIVAAFDNDKAVINNHSRPNILPMIEFKNYCQNHNVKIGIITVGKEAAQEICDEMIEEGIIAIWNFAPCKLNVPSGIVIVNENLALSLAHLNNLLN